MQNKIIIFRIKEAWNKCLAKIISYGIKGKKNAKVISILAPTINVVKYIQM